MAQQALGVLWPRQEGQLDTTAGNISLWQRTRTGRLSLTETASGPQALRAQLHPWEQYHMHLLQATEGHVLQLLPMNTPGGSGGKGAGLGFHGQDNQLGW